MTFDFNKDRLLLNYDLNHNNNGNATLTNGPGFSSQDQSDSKGWRQDAVATYQKRFTDKTKKLDFRYNFNRNQNSFIFNTTGSTFDLENSSDQKLSNLKFDYSQPIAFSDEGKLSFGSLYEVLSFQTQNRNVINLDYERKTTAGYFEFQTIISAQDQNYIAHPDQKQMLVLPNGIDATFFENLDVVQKFDFVFVGNLSYPPNIDAVNYILDNILPLYPNRTLLVAGAKPSKQIVSKISKVKNCTLLAGMKDIRAAYLQGKIFLAPMQIGTGMQNKILEAMALGIPCITSSLVNNAIQGKQKKHLWVADQIHEIKEGIDWLLLDNNNYKKIQEDAKVFIKNQYQWTEIIARLHKKISSK